MGCLELITRTLRGVVCFGSAECVEVRCDYRRDRAVAWRWTHQSRVTQASRIRNAKRSTGTLPVVVMVIYRKHRSLTVTDVNTRNPTCKCK